MNKKLILKNTKDFVKNTLSKDSTGHDWWHIYRVWKLSLYIAKKEKNKKLFIVELGALLHDIADFKFHNGDETVGPKVAREWLERQNVPEEIITQVVHIVESISYKGAKVKNTMQSLEGKIVQDADRLDALGAIGIARTFAYGGYKGREMYNPHIKPEIHTNSKSYKNSTGPTINHFYEKLLLLKDKMNTKTAKQLALKRHKFMEKYLEEFYREWDVVL